MSFQPANHPLPLEDLASECLRGKSKHPSCPLLRSLLTVTPSAERRRVRVDPSPTGRRPPVRRAALRALEPDTECPHHPPLRGKQHICGPSNRICGPSNRICVLNPLFAGESAERAEHLEPGERVRERELPAVEGEPGQGSGVRDGGQEPGGPHQGGIWRGAVQCSAVQVEAAKDQVKVPQTMEEYCAKEPVAEKADMPDLYNDNDYYNDYDDESEEQSSSSDSEAGQQD
jgi:hypothetical protein